MCIDYWIDFVADFLKSFKNYGLTTAMKLVTPEVLNSLSESQDEWLRTTLSALEDSSVACASDTYEAISTYRQEQLSLL